MLIAVEMVSETASARRGGIKRATSPGIWPSAAAVAVAVFIYAVVREGAPGTVVVTGPSVIQPVQWPIHYSTKTILSANSGRMEQTMGKAVDEMACLGTSAFEGEILSVDAD
jgi:hypothetical protein